MQIRVGYTTDEKEKADKTFTVTHSYNKVVLKENTSIVRPTLILATVDDLSTINYVYIPTFKRYYFATVTALTGGRIALECVVDPLTSFKSDIRKCKAIIDKQESESFSSPYINDGSYVTECREVIQNLQFPNGFNKTATIIITSGG